MSVHYNVFCNDLMYPTEIVSFREYLKFVFIIITIRYILNDKFWVLALVYLFNLLIVIVIQLYQWKASY